MSAPTISFITPTSGPGSGATPVTIYGTGFVAPASVTFGGKAALSVNVVSSTEITCLTPSQTSAGTVTVTVTDANGTASFAPTTYTVNGTCYPWNYTDPTYPFSPTIFLGFGNGTPPVNIAVSPGGYLSLTYLSGLVNNQNVSGPFSDADGVAGLYITGSPMQDYFSPGPPDLSLCGGWADSSGNLVAPPFLIGNSAVIGPAPAGTTQVLMGVNDYPEADNTGFWHIQVNGFDYVTSNGAATQFTPIFPPIKKQPLGFWGLEAVRHESLTSAGLKSSVTERVDSVTTLIFNYVALSDMAAWKALHAYSLTGGVFTYRPLLDYPNFTSTDPMFQYPGTDNGDDAAGYAVCQMVSMDFVPKFESPGAFSLSMKLRLIADVPANFVEAVGS